jgi:hypothetical protein
MVFLRRLWCFASGMRIRAVSSTHSGGAVHVVPAALAVAIGLFAAVRPAHADRPRDTPTAIEVDRDAAPAGRIGLGFDGGEPVDAWGASIAAGWTERPIRLSSGAFGDGSPATEPVRRRETLSLGGALAVGDSVVIDLAIRASHQIGDRLIAIGNPDRLARYVLHDLRFGGRIRVVGDRDRGAFLRADVTLPTGDAAQFAGDARWTAAWGLIGRASLSNAVVIAATAGVRLHGAEVAIADRLVGNALFAAAGVAVPLPQAGPLARLAAPAMLTGALLGSLGDDVGTLSGPSPLEARLGVIVQLSTDFAVGVHAGAGLDDQIGAPRLRAVVELAWTPRVARAAPPVTAPRSEPPDPDREPGDDPDDDDETPGAPSAPSAPARSTPSAPSAPPAPARSAPSVPPAPAPSAPSAPSAQPAPPPSAPSAPSAQPAPPLSAPSVPSAPPAPVRSAPSAPSAPPAQAP